MPAPEKAPVNWPEDFASPRVAAAIAAVVVLAGALLLGLAAFDGLHWIKIILAWYLGFDNPLAVSPSSWDVAVVLGGMLSLIAAAVVHPSAGIGVLLLFRPWLDGYTYPGDNVYFLWAIFFLTALWAARLLLRGESFRFVTPLALFLAFFIVAMATTAGSIQFARSYHELLLWFGYLMLFLIASNSLRTRMAIGIVFICLAVSMLAESVYSILHFEYLLPYLRRMLMERPDVRLKFFGVDAFTPELVRRFNVNRAWGSMLFPNALAAFLILGIPYATAGARLGWRGIGPAWHAAAGFQGREPGLSPRYRAVACGAAAWLVATVAMFAGALFALVYQIEDVSPERILIGLGSAAAVLALAPAVFIFWIVDNRGIRVCGLVLRACGLTALAFLQCWALWITYSRGAMLALAVAVTAGVGLWRIDRADLRHWAKRFAVPAAVLALALAVLVGAGVTVRSCAAPPASGAEDGVLEQGVNLSAIDLLDPASLGLRFTYWRVGLTMFRHHLWSGVGLGNFGLAYPRYQYLGAGPVRLAHNGYLQMFCETGLFGGLLFLAFWAYVVLCGAWRIIGEADRGKRMLLTGMYVGIVAFLLHSFIDIQFSNPSLAMIFIAVTGLFFACSVRPPSGAFTAPEPPPLRGRILHQLAALPLLAALALATGVSLREYLQNLSISRVSLLNVANNDNLERRQRVCRILVEETNAYGWNRTLPRPIVPVPPLRELIPDLNSLHKLGVFFAPLPDVPKSARKIMPGEPIPNEAYFVINRPYDTRELGVQVTEAWAKEVLRADAWFPYGADLPVYVSNLYQMLYETMQGGEKYQEMDRRFSSGMMRWIEEAVRRSPTHADVRITYGRLLWTRAGIEEGAARLETYQKALEQFRLASALNPTVPTYLAKYGEALQELAIASEKSGKEAEFEAYTAQAKEVQARVTALETARRELGIE